MLYKLLPYHKPMQIKEKEEQVEQVLGFVIDFIVTLITVQIC